MRRKCCLIVLVFIFLMFFVQGCATPTEGNPFGIADPNQAQGWIDYGVAIGAGAQGAGAATGNPYLLVYGAGLLTLLGVVRSVLFPKKQ